MTINELQDNVIEEFSVFDDWMDKYALLTSSFIEATMLTSGLLK